MVGEEHLDMLLIYFIELNPMIEASSKKGLTPGILESKVPIGTKKSHSQQKYWCRDAKFHMLLKNVFDECVLIISSKVSLQRPDPNSEVSSLCQLHT